MSRYALFKEKGEKGHPVQQTIHTRYGLYVQYHHLKLRAE